MSSLVIGTFFQYNTNLQNERRGGIRVLVNSLNREEPEGGPISPGHQFDWDAKYPFCGSMKSAVEIYKSLAVIPHPEPKPRKRRAKKNTHQVEPK